MRFRTSLLLSMVLLVTALLAATASGVAFVLHRAAERDVATYLYHTRELFGDLYDYRKSVYRYEARVVAEEPHLRAVMADDNASPEEMIRVAEAIQREIESDLFLMTDEAGRLLFDAFDKTSSGYSMRDLPIVAGALTMGEATGVLTHEGKAYQVQALRLSIEDQPFGVVLLGYIIDDSIASMVEKLTESAVVIELDYHPIPASRIRGAEGVGRDALGPILARVSEDLSAPPTEITLGGNRYLAVSAPLTESGGSTRLRYVVIRSLDAAYAPAHAAVKVTYTATAVALVAAMLLAVLFSRRLSRPLDGLVAFIDAVAQGKLAQRAPLGGPVEVRALGAAMNRMVDELEESRRHIASKERLEKELEIGARIQTSILPRQPLITGLEIATAMIPASEVGGDYYDLHPTPDGGWIGIGDVAGHGLTTGLIMLMVQSTVAALIRHNPGASPREIVVTVNEVLVENIRQRLKNDEYVTLTLLRYHPDGRIIFAGAHEEIVVLRKVTGCCELVQTPGPWLGARRDISASTIDSSLKLEDGDVVVLYTDGITEAMNVFGAQFGLERLTALVEREQNSPVERIRDEILGAVAEWTETQSDDISLLVLRYTGNPAERLL